MFSVKHTDLFKNLRFRNDRCLKLFNLPWHRQQVASAPKFRGEPCGHCYYYWLLSSRITKLCACSCLSALTRGKTENQNTFSASCPKQKKQTVYKQKHACLGILCCYFTLSATNQHVKTVFVLGHWNLLRFIRDGTWTLLSSSCMVPYVHRNHKA